MRRQGLLAHIFATNVALDHVVLELNHDRIWAIVQRSSAVYSTCRSSTARRGQSYIGDSILARVGILKNLYRF